jgi:DNA polymerase III epsilon subunit-like protein
MEIMIDLETLDTRPTAAILSIGAVSFDPATGEVGGTFYARIDPEDAKKYGTTSPSTLRWWDEQTEAAREEAFSGKDSLKTALQNLTAFILHDLPKTVWANDPDFDCAILSNAYRECKGCNPPWRFWHVASMRTMVKLGRELYGINPKADIPLEGEAHNALADAQHQAKVVSAIYRALAAGG